MFNQPTAESPTSLRMAGLALLFILCADVIVYVLVPLGCRELAPTTLTPIVQAEPGELSFTQQVIDNNYVSYQRTVGDLDGDGHNDIVAINDSDELLWYEAPNWPHQVLLKLQNSTHGYTLFRGDDMKLADIDADGDLDVVVRIGANDDIDGKMVWFRNPRPGEPVTGTWSMIDIGINEYTKDIVVRDIDRDGKLDVVTREDSRTQVWFQNSPSNWTRKEISHPPHEGMDVGDLDGDGDDDIVLDGFWLETPANPRTGTYTQHTIDSKWFTNQSAGWQNYSCKVVVADIDANGRQDVVLSHSELPGFPVSWYSAADPRGTWTEHVITPACDYCHNLQAADFDQDGYMDVLAGGMIQSPHRGLTLYRGNGGEAWESMAIQSLGSYSAELGDIDDDHDLDIIGLRQWNLPPVEIWRNELYRPPSLDRWFYIEADSTRGSWGDWDEPGWLRYFGLAFGDIDRDGDLDIVSGRYFYRNPGGEMTAAWQRIDFGFNVDALLTVDVDGDAFGDVIGTRGSTVYWLEADDAAGTTWTARTIDTSAPTESHVNPQGYVVADVVSGGRPEILLANGGKVFYYSIPASNPQAGAWPRTEILNDSNSEGIGIGDINGDGRLDVAVAHFPPGAGSAGPRDIKWARNPGDGSANWPEFIIGSFPGDYPDRFAIADLNGDGRPDIIVTPEQQPAEPIYSTCWFEAPADPTQSNWTRHTLVTQHTTNSMDVADMDGDGDMDVILGEHRSNTNNEKVAIWENNGTGTFTEHVVDRGKESHLGTRVADLNGDGMLDIVSIAWDEYWYLHVWRNDGAGHGPGSDNQPPVVEARPRRSVYLGDTLILYGIVTDDGLPNPPASVTRLWRKVSGPGPVTFGNPQGAVTSTQFDTAGMYVLELVANDGELSGSNQIAIEVLRPWQRVGIDLLAWYTFQEAAGSTVLDRSGVSPPLNLNVGDPESVAWERRGLKVVAATSIRSTLGAAKIHSALRASEELTVEAWLQPAHTSKSEPATITTLSIGADQTNFTLGQMQARYETHLRTTDTNMAGQPAVYTPYGSLSTALAHVVYTRGKTGQVRVYINGTTVVDTIVEGDLSNWDTRYSLALAGEPGGARPWLGTLHMVAVYGRALSPAEIVYNFAAGYWINPGARYGDFDGDGDVDQEDLGHIQRCLTGPSLPQMSPLCIDSRLDTDSDVDYVDMTRFLRCLSGPGQNFNPTCAD